MECGGKRSATPLWRQWAGSSQQKAPSPLRSAGALQIVFIVPPLTVLRTTTIVEHSRKVDVREEHRNSPAMKKRAFIAVAIGVVVSIGILATILVPVREPVSLTFVRYEPWPAAKLKLTNNSRKTITYVTSLADAPVLSRLKTSAGWTNTSPLIMSGTRIQTTFGGSGTIVSSTTNQYYFLGDLIRLKADDARVGVEHLQYLQLQTHKLEPGQSGELYLNLEVDGPPRRVGTVCIIPQGTLAQQFARWINRVKGLCRIKSKSTVPGQVEVWCNEPLQISSKPTHGTNWHDL
jgi:hypothetical protein